jgi:hypothetical protein
MRRVEHQVARVVAGWSLAAGAAYLAWRLTGSMHGTPGWLALPTIALELFGFVATALLAWALWPMPTVRSRNPSSGPVGPVDAVVRVDDQPPHEVRATLLALRKVHGVSGVVLVDLSGRPAVAALAVEFQAVYAASDPDDRNGLRVMASAVQSPEFLLLDAGDVPTADIVEVLAADLVDSQVAVVQGLGVSLQDDSPEHGPSRRHELVFERSSLNPALGRRNAAMWLGSGSLVRVAAVRDVASSNALALSAQWRAGAALLAAGWRVTAPSHTAVLAHRTLTSDAAVHRDRVERACSARRLVLGRHGALRARHLSARQRAALLAWSVRPLSGVRRAVFIGVVCGSLLAGKVPFHAQAGWLAAAWLPFFVGSSLGLSLLSGWTLRPGDRTRWSLQTVGPACNSLLGDPLPTKGRVARPPIVNHPAGRYGAGLVMAVILLCVVITLRGLSERVTHTLGAMSQSELMAVLGVALWLLAISLELLRVLAGRGHVRRSPRVAASLPSVLAERAVSIIDLTPIGAGVMGHTGADIGEHLVLETSIPTASGETPLSVPVIVRNARLLRSGVYRIGVEFVSTDDAATNALAEFCLVEPMWERLGVMPGRSVTEVVPNVFVDDDEYHPRAGRAVVRLVAMVALVGAVASTVPSTVGASPSLEHRLDGAVTATSGAVPGAVVTGVCADDAGRDRAWGTTDDRYTPPVSAVSGAEGSYALALHGVACWAGLALPAGFVADGPLAAVASAAGPMGLRAIDVSGRVEMNRTVARALGPSSIGTGELGDLVWNDLNRDGLREAEEPGVAGVALTLLDIDGRVVARQVSDSDGRYLFRQLAPGVYRVGASNLPQGTSFAAPTPSSDSAIDSDVDEITGRSVLVQLEDGASVRSIDIGLRSDVAPSSVRSPAAVSRRVLASPSTSQLAMIRTKRSMLGVLVVLTALAMAVSVLLGVARPRRRVRRQVLSNP